jgi:hypothetical protein
MPERWEVTMPTNAFTERTSEVIREVAADVPTIFGIGLETAIAAATGAGGLGLIFGGLKLAKVLFTKNRKGGQSNAVDTNFPLALPRDNSEIEQIISLRQQEQREPLHDAFFGILFEDEYRSNPNQSVKEAFQASMARFNNVAPLSSTATSTQITTTKE